MAQLIVRNIDDDLVQRLKERAAKHGRSAEAEHREILKQALLSDWEAWLQEADRLRAETEGTKQTDSGELIREDRDRRAGLID